VIELFRYKSINSWITGSFCSLFFLRLRYEKKYG